MSNLEKYRKVQFNTQEFINEIIPKKLKKDLKPNEQICTTCKGISFVIDKFKSYPKDEKGKRTSKIKQSLRRCPDCYNGVQELCDFCGEVKDKRQYGCKCKGYEQKQKEKREQEIKNKIKKAKKITLKESDFECFYEPYRKKYYTIDEIYDYKNNELSQIKYLFGTEKYGLNMSAYRLLEDSLEEHHEEAYDFISNKQLDKLQNLLDEWCKNQKVYSFRPDFEIVVKIRLTTPPESS